VPAFQATLEDGLIMLCKISRLKNSMTCKQGILPVLNARMSPWDMWGIT